MAKIEGKERFEATAKIATKEEIADVYLKHQKALFCLALTYVDSIYVAEELVADAIIAVFERSPVFACEASCLCYLKQTVRNRAINILRRKYKIEAHEEEDIEKHLINLNEYKHPFNEVEVQMLLHELLVEYPKDIRDAFIAHVIDQETIPVLAAYYGIKTDTLRKQIGRMKKRIAKSISGKDMRAFLFLIILLS